MSARNSWLRKQPPPAAPSWLPPLENFARVRRHPSWTKVSTGRFNSLREQFRKKAAKVLLQPPFLQAKLLCLQHIFGFAQSHDAAAPADDRHKSAALNLIANLKPETVVEFGSGLGGIVESIEAQNRFGFDTDKGAIAAAKFLHGTDPHYFQASFLDCEAVVRTLRAFGVEAIDVLILTNWIHKVPTEKLLRGLAAIHARISVRYLLLEAIKPEYTGCDYQLSVTDLARFGEILRGAEAGEVSSLHIVTMADFESTQLLRLRQAVGSSAPHGGPQC